MTITILRPETRILTFAPGLNVRGALATGGDWWVVPGKTCVAAYQPKGAASYAASKVNLANPGTFDAVDGVAFPSWAALTGWTYLAANTECLTGITAGGLNDNTMTYICRFSNVTVGAVTGAGGSASSNRTWIGPTGVTYRVNTTTAVAPGVATGVLGVTLTGAGGIGYRNGASDGAVGTTYGGSSTGWLMGAWYSSTGAFQNYLTGNILAIAYYSDTLTPAEMATLSTAMAAL